MEIVLVKKINFMSALSEFRDFCFSLVGARDHKELSKHIIDLQRPGINIVADIQDQVMDSNEFKSFCQHDGWVSLASEVLGIPNEECTIVFPHFRIDLPKNFTSDKQTMSLPWHQEASYFLNMGNCSPSSIVLSTYLHDCQSDCGAMEIGSNATDELLNHDKQFMDPANSRFLRMSCKEPSEFRVMETRYGETIIFDFHKPHRSGLNSTSDSVRLTLLLRASAKKDVERFAKSGCAV